MLNIFVNTWGNYNENGADGGEWITLPMDPEELEEVLESIASKMGDNDTEWFINDYEWTTEIDLGEVDEMDSISHWNELLQDADSLDEYEAEEIAAAMEAFGYDFQEALSRQSRGCFCFYRGQDLEDVAYDLVEECYLTKETPDVFKSYFDYAAFARDLGFDGYTETKWGVIVDR